VTTRFADTAFYIALLNPRDEYHEAACKLATEFGGSMITTAWVITEVANQMSKPRNRAEFVSLLSDLENHDRVEIFPRIETSMIAACNSMPSGWIRSGR
jgi:predicted nucleic acid-binding protein